MRIIKNGIISGFFYLFLTLFICSYGSATMFYHEHVINGKIFLHSHIHKSGEDADSSHSHTTEELVLIHFIKHTVWNSYSFIPEIQKPEVSLTVINCNPEAIIILSCINNEASPRSPPFI